MIKDMLALLESKLDDFQQHEERSENAGYKLQKEALLIRYEFLKEEVKRQQSLLEIMKSQIEKDAVFEGASRQQEQKVREKNEEFDRLKQEIDALDQNHAKKMEAIKQTCAEFKNQGNVEALKIKEKDQTRQTLERIEQQMFNLRLQQEKQKGIMEALDGREDEQSRVATQKAKEEAARLGEKLKVLALERKEANIKAKEAQKVVDDMFKGTKLEHGQGVEDVVMQKEDLSVST